MFILHTIFYDEEPEKQRLMEEDWYSEDTLASHNFYDELKSKEWYWENKHLSKCDGWHGDEDTFVPTVYVKVPAPMEKQPYPEYINCEEFTVWRKVALDAVSKYKDPRTHGFLAELDIPFGHPDAKYSGHPGIPEYRAEVHLGHRLYKPTLMSWLNKTKSDIEFQEYFSASLKESEGFDWETPSPSQWIDKDTKVYSSQPKPKLWRDEYLGYDNYCPFEAGEYVSDGIYASEGWVEDQLYLYKLSDDNVYNPKTGEEIDGW